MPPPRQQTRSALALRGVPLSATPATADQGYVLVDGVWTPRTLVQSDDSRMANDRTASGLRSATTVVSVSAATAPTTGQVLTATGDSAATWQTPAGGGGGAKALWGTSLPAAGLWYTDPGYVNNGTGTFATGTMYGIYFYSGKGGTLDQYGANVSTNLPGGTFRLSIYELDASTRYPAGLLANSDTGELSAASLGTVASSAGLGAELAPDTWYLRALHTSGTVSFSRSGIASAMSSIRTDGTSTNLLSVLNGTAAYGAPPATFPAAASLGMSATTLWIPFYKFSAVG